MGHSSIVVTASLMNVGTLRNQGLLTLTGALVDSGRLLNDDSIVVGSGAGGISMTGGAVLSNAGNGHITAAADAITAGGNVQIYNFGTVLSTGTASGLGGMLLADGGLIHNGNASDTAALITGSRYGVSVSAGSLRLSNEGTIAATGAAGIAIDAGAGLVLNSGTIEATAGIGIAVAGGTIVDLGAIIGGHTAVAFSGTAANVLELEHGYRVSGAVVGSASASNMLELRGASAADAVAANYTGLGLTNFGTVAFAPGANNYAALTISNDARLPRAITHFTGVHDTIDLTALNDSAGNATTPFNSVTHQLTVTAGTASVTLQLGRGSYVGIDWTARNGSNGTELTPTLSAVASATMSAAAGADTVQAGSGTGADPAGSGADPLRFIGRAAGATPDGSAGPGSGGNDSLVAGVAADTPGGGNLPMFINLHARGSAATPGFVGQTARDRLGNVATVSHAPSLTSGTTIALPDHTTVTFLGVSDIAGLTGHVFSR